MDFINKIFRGDRVVWMIFMFLCLISIIEVYSASSTLTYKRDYWEPIMRHTSFLLGGLAFVLLVHCFRPKYLSVFIILLPVSCLLLIATRKFGVQVNGAFRSFLGFQPSEIAKLCLIISVAFILSRRGSLFSEKSAFLWICSFTVITCGLIFIDNFSTGVMLYAVVIIMMYIGQISLKKLSIMSLVTVAVLVLILLFTWTFPEKVKKTPFERALTWVGRMEDRGWIPQHTTAENRANNNKEKEKQNTTDIRKGDYVINDDNYQVSHAKIALARGGIFGKGPGNSKQRDYLPQAYSDFIFAIIIEEMGIAGGIAVLALYVFLFIRAGIIAKRCEAMFPKLLVMGSALIIMAQALANIAVAVDLIPVTGQPLPLISRGGTSTIVTCVFIGIILSASRFENPKGIRREEEIAEELEEEVKKDSENHPEEDSIVMA
jgi:cell division protein FtsW